MFSPDTGKYRPEKLRIWIFHAQWYIIETKNTMQPILYSSRPIRLQIFCTLAIKPLVLQSDTVSTE